MHLTKYSWLSIFSGCVWAVVAYLLSFELFGSLIMGGLLAAPLIGLLVGTLYRPAYKFSHMGQTFLSLITLYLAAIAFSLAIGIYDVLWSGVPDRHSGEVIMQPVLATLWGVTAYIWILWPMAFLNHRLLGIMDRA